MACYSPIKGWRTPSGKLTMRMSEGWWDLPPAIVACGGCVGCRRERARQWAVRCMHETKMHERSCFITLTYDDQHLPEGGTLHAKHFPNFIKRLRKHYERRRGANYKLRYFHCGEYGTRTARPHYHALLFGIDFSEDRRFLKREGKNNLYTSSLLDSKWTHGYCNIGSASFESAAYIARYTMKKQTGKEADSYYELGNPVTGEVTYLKHPYLTMSRRPGIGRTWLDKYQGDVYPSDEVIVNGRKTRPPKYYDQQLDIVEPKLLEELKAKRKTKAVKHSQNNTPERLLVRERIAQAKIELQKRPI